MVVIVASTLIAASTAAGAGIIGWVGLVIPHAARILLGAESQRVLPALAAIGACYRSISIAVVAGRTYAFRLPLPPRN